VERFSVGNSCHISSLGISGSGSGTVTNVATDATLTGGPITTTGTFGLNLGNNNWWTTRQNFTNASTSQFTATSTVWFTGLTNALLATDNTGKLVATTSIGVNYLSGILPITNGGTNNNTAYTAGSVIFSDGTKLTQNNSNFFWNNNYNLLGVGTSTPFWSITAASSSGPQIALTDTTAGSNAWTFRSTGNSLFLATSTATATSTVAALAIDPNGAATFGNNLTVNGTTLFTGLGTFTSGYVSQASSTIVGNFTATGFDNTSGTTGGYKIDNNLILQASSTNFATIVGQLAAPSILSTTLGNTAIGYQSLNSATSSTQNTAVGYQALWGGGTTVSNSGENTAIGFQALRVNAGGNQNTAIGNQTLRANTTGSSNTALGYFALNANTTGTLNTAVGHLALTELWRNLGDELIRRRYVTAFQ
jgi:trimeric autotransporter adhesin